MDGRTEGAGVWLAITVWVCALTVLVTVVTVVVGEAMGYCGVTP